jgi:hypothetical protein
MWILLMSRRRRSVPRSVFRGTSLQRFRAILNRMRGGKRKGFLRRAAIGSDRMREYGGENQRDQPAASDQEFEPHIQKLANVSASQCSRAHFNITSGKTL